MTPEEREELNRLCKQIAVEQDHKVFTKLIEQLNELLSRTDDRLGERDREKLWHGPNNEMTQELK